MVFVPFSIPSGDSPQVMLGAILQCLDTTDRMYNTLSRHELGLKKFVVYTRRPSVSLCISYRDESPLSGSCFTALANGDAFSSNLTRFEYLLKTSNGVVLLDSDRNC